MSAVKLSTINMQINLQVIENQVTIMSALGDIALMLGLSSTVSRISERLMENTATINSVQVKIDTLTKEIRGG